MTAQISEKLIYEDERHAMCTNPLDLYFNLSDSDFVFESTCTALWRGYVGTWEIKGDRLYLIELNGRLKDGSEATLATVFPDFPERVFAHWYSGLIRLPQGKMLNYVHMGYSSTYERDLFLDIENGVVVSSSVRTNGTSDNPDAKTGYSVGAMTVFGRNDVEGSEQ